MINEIKLISEENNEVLVTIKFTGDEETRDVFAELDDCNEEGLNSIAAKIIDKRNSEGENELSKNLIDRSINTRHILQLHSTVKWITETFNDDLMKEHFKTLGKPLDEQIDIVAKEVLLYLRTILKPTGMLRVE